MLKNSLNLKIKRRMLLKNRKAKVKKFIRRTGSRQIRKKSTIFQCCEP